MYVHIRAFIGSSLSLSLPAGRVLDSARPRVYIYIHVYSRNLSTRFFMRYVGRPGGRCEFTVQFALRINGNFNGVC